MVMNPARSWSRRARARFAVIVPVAQFAAFALVTVAACGPGKSEPRPPVATPIPETCAVQLAPRAASSSAVPLAAAFAAARSTVVVQVEVPLAGVKQALEAKVPRRVAEERDHDIGVAGRLEYTVDRGSFTLRVENGALVVETPLQGHAQACAKGRCYAGCAPELKATARVPLRLSADYKLHTSEVRIDVTRGCEIRALGGLLTVDVTPALRGAVAAQSHNVQASIDRELPDLGPEAARLWAELAKPRPLPLGACVMLEPEEITQGPASGTVDLAKLRFGLLARPEVRVQCAGKDGLAAPAPKAPSKLPPLHDDPALGPAGDVHLAIVMPDEAPARALERAEPIDFGGKRARVKQASGDVGGGLVLGLSGEVCGDVGVRAAGAAFTGAQDLHLVGAAIDAADVERLSASQLDGARVFAAVEHASITLPVAIDGLGAMLPELAQGMSDDRMTVNATVESSKPETAGLRGPSLVAVALLRGSVTLRAK